MDDNLKVFRTAEVVSAYSDLIGHRDCEEFLFATYVTAGMDILDLGVGGGRTAALLAPASKSYLGIDYSEEMIAVAGNSFPQFRFSVMDAPNMSMLESKSFDLIHFSFNGLAFLHPDNKRLDCVRECQRLLRERGLFIFSVFNPYSIIVRPSRDARTISATIRGIVAAIRATASRSIQRFGSEAFWFGCGYLTASAHGASLTTFAASRARVRRELECDGFVFVGAYEEQYPKRLSFLMSRWNYFVFPKPDN